MELLGQVGGAVWRTFETLKLWNFETFATLIFKTLKQGARAREGCWSARRVAGGKAGGEELTAMEITSWFSTKSSTPPSTTSMRSWSFLEEGLSARSHPQRVKTFLSIITCFATGGQVLEERDERNCRHKDPEKPPKLCQAGPDWSLHPLKTQVIT